MEDITDTSYRYFGDNETAQKTLESIRGYMPTVAHWAWNGNARRYWDFNVAGGIARIERQIHHYGSPLNAIPLLDAYKYHHEPNGSAALHDLRVGFGGWQGALTNINDAGFGSQGFHAWPETMEWDPYSSDYGCGLLGHMISSTTFLVENSDFGYLSFGGNLVSSGDTIKVEPKDTVRRQIYVAPLGLKFEVNAGVIEEFTYDITTKAVSIQIGEGESKSGGLAMIRWESTLGIDVKTQQGSHITLPGEVGFTLS